MTAGTGHRRAAEALAAAASAAFPQATVTCADLLDHTPRWFRRSYGWSYLFLVRHLPWIWNISYALLEHRAVFACVQPLRRAWNLLIARRFVAWLQREPPDLLLATHFLPADLCREGKRRGWLRGVAVVVVTDLHPHRFWISPECEAMVVATPESGVVCRRRGVSADRVHVVGIPIGAGFSRSFDRAAIQRSLGLESARQTVLVTSGGTTVGWFERVVGSLLALEATHPGRVQLLVVCGMDEAARRRLDARARGHAMPVRVFGFVERMPELMAASDLLVTKAGGLTMSEALARRLPMVLYHIIPGQERMNAQHAAQAGAAIIAPHPSAVADAVVSSLEHPDRLNAMREAAGRVGHADAAPVILTRVVRPLLAGREA